MLPTSDKKARATKKYSIFFSEKKQRLYFLLPISYKRNEKKRGEKKEIKFGGVLFYKKVFLHLHPF